MMDVTWEIRSGALIGRLNGEIDISNASAIHADILRGLSTSQGPLLLDLSGITYLDSAGIRVLFEVATPAGNSSGAPSHRPRTGRGQTPPLNCKI